MGWRTLLEECGDALLDDGSKQLPFYFAIWRFDGEMWARRPAGGTVAAGACSSARGVFLGLTPLLQQETGHGRCQQSVLARSLASLTLFTQSSRQLCRAPSIVTQDTPLWNTPRAWYSFNTLFLFVFCFIVAFFLFVCFCSLNVGYLQSYACGWKGNFFSSQKENINFSPLLFWNLTNF